MEDDKQYLTPNQTVTLRIAINNFKKEGKHTEADFLLQVLEDFSEPLTIAESLFSQINSRGMPPYQKRALKKLLILANRSCGK